MTCSFFKIFFYSSRPPCLRLALIPYVSPYHRAQVHIMRYTPRGNHCKPDFIIQYTTTTTTTMLPAGDLTDGPRQRSKFKQLAVHRPCARVLLDIYLLHTYHLNSLSSPAHYPDGSRRRRRRRRRRGLRDGLFVCTCIHIICIYKSISRHNSRKKKSWFSFDFLTEQERKTYISSKQKQKTTNELPAATVSRNRPIEFRRFPSVKLSRPQQQQ